MTDIFAFLYYRDRKEEEREEGRKIASDASCHKETQWESQEEAGSCFARTVLLLIHSLSLFRQGNL